MKFRKCSGSGTNENGQKDADRLVPALSKVHAAKKAGRIEESDQIVGVIGEVGPVTGRTDLNWILDDFHKDQLSHIAHEFLSLSAR